MSPAERRVWDAYPSGTWVDLRAEDPDDNLPADGANWDADREIRAELIAALLTGAREPEPGKIPGVRLAGARIVGDLTLSDAEISDKLNLLTCYIPGAVHLTDASAKGIRLRGCDIHRIRAGRAHINGVFELDGTRVRAGIRLDNAHITGQFRMSRAHISAPPPYSQINERPFEDTGHPYTKADLAERGYDQHKWAVWAGGLTVDGGTFMRDLRAEGGLRLIGGTFVGGLYLQRSTITATGGLALLGDFLTARAAEFSAGFTSEGGIRLRGAHIGGVLSFDKAHLSAEGRVLHLSHMQVDELILTTASTKGEITLGYSRIGVLLDHPTGYAGKVHLNGTTYDSLRGDWTVAQRLDWVSRDPDGYRPQPYEQLATWYRRIGHEPDARRVMLAKQREHRTTLRPTGRAWGRLLDAIVGYGYRPWQAALWAAVLLTTGTIVFGLEPPTQIDPDHRRTFNSFVYTLDLLVPVSVFEQRAAWDPAGWTRWLAWTLIASDWILATALIAGTARVLRPPSPP
ncbi:hypothetical protein SAMN05421505_13630 [Sinosporangium album]|uniref:Oxidoreductase n=1 Tax=Sinosporangium album TaxID=504805 RepID=A0A1G8IAT5_9ACTN|nr:hypothetical protein [Sinosporangium album]SDI16045.1 hypothetical protein SAMN05421505_13630 [Sinosporangium album]